MRLSFFDVMPRGFSSCGYKSSSSLAFQSDLCYNRHMRKTFRYRIHPTKGQVTKMNAILEKCRWLYNYLLDQRKVAYEQTNKGLSLYDQHAILPALKLVHPSLNIVHSQVLQNVAVRIDLAFKAFFRRCKAGENPGYPRFRGQGRYDSFCYPQYPSGCHVNETSVRLSKIGNVRLVAHRPLEGTPKTVCVRRTPAGKWFITVSCEVEPWSLSRSSEQVGIDVGLTSFATLSDGEKVDNPRFFRRDEKVLAKAQRRLNKELNSTPERRKRKKVVVRIHERIANRRHNFTHQESRRIVNRFDFIAIEDLSINRMIKNHYLAKSIMDVAWSNFAHHLSYKAEWAGREYIAVNPAYTSQDCSNCGYRQDMPLSNREYHCPNCNLVLDRDHNAARNILRLGLQSAGTQPLEAVRSLDRAE